MHTTWMELNIISISVEAKHSVAELLYQHN